MRKKGFISKAMQSVLAIAVAFSPIVGGAATASAQTNIVGGQDAARAWTVSLQSSHVDSTGHVVYRHECGGALIAPRWVLTAKHCEPYIHGFARVGSLQWASGGELIPVADVIVYPQPGPHQSFGNDVALVKLSRPISPDSLKYLLPLGVQGGNGTVSTVAGWGLTCDTDITDPVCGSSTPAKLQQLDLKVVPDSDCTLISPDTGMDLNDPATMNCYVPVKPNTGPCFGDSGSPFLRTVNGVPRVVGLDNAEMSTTVLVPHVCSVAPNGGPYHEADSDVGHFIPWIIHTILTNGDPDGAALVQQNAGV